MRLSVAANFDDKLLDNISAYPVEDIYGKLSYDPVGGGRAGYTTQGVDIPRLKSHIEYAHEKGIKFNYLLNAACMGNKEWTKNGMRAVRRLLDMLAGMKVDSVTVSIPYLAEVIKKRYPDFFLKVSMYANIDNPTRAKFWQDLGADMLTLEPFSINRNFTALKAIRKSVSCRLQLIANFACLSSCPMEIYHMTGLSHASSSVSKEPFIDYCALKCSFKMLENPEYLIKAQWIRPEDVKAYEDIGYSDFKLLERNTPTETMTNRVVAYAHGVSPPNLLELIRPYGFKKPVKTAFGWKAKYFFAFMGSNLRLEDLMALLKKRGLMHPLEKNPEVLDSGRIPKDFLSEITKRTCSLSGSCSDCGYCRVVAESAYKVDSAHKEECLKLYERVFDQLCSR